MGEALADQKSANVDVVERTSKMDLSSKLTWWRDSATTLLSGSTCITAAHLCFWSSTAPVATDSAIVSSSILSWGGNERFRKAHDVRAREQGRVLYS